MNLKEKRIEAGFSQSQLAKASGVGLRLIQQIEQGTRTINKSEAANVYKLAQALNVTMEELLDLEKLEKETE